MNTELLDFYHYCGIYDNFGTDRCNDRGNSELVCEYKRYSSLWGAVILQAMIDLTSNYQRTENKLEKIKALNWINDLHEDFVTVCYLAGYSPLYVRDKARKAMLGTSRSK